MQSPNEKVIWMRVNVRVFIRSPKGSFFAVKAYRQLARVTGSLARVFAERDYLQKHVEITIGEPRTSGH